MKQLIAGILFSITVMQMFNVLMVVHPVSTQVKTVNKLQVAAIKLGMGDPGEKILNAVSLMSKQTGKPQELLLSLAYSESCFKLNAVSKKGYNGLFQIPQKVFHPVANALIAGDILMGKLEIAGGDYHKAIMLYKGWGKDMNSPEGKRQAQDVIVLARKLKEG